MKTHFPDPFCKDGRMDGHYNFRFLKNHKLLKLNRRIIGVISTLK